MVDETTRSASQPSGPYPVPGGLYRRQNTGNELRTFVWNSETREFLGRTKISWAKTGLFFVIFYAFLALFFYVMMAVFYLTLDTEGRPKWTGGDDAILKNVGLALRPTTDLKKGPLTIAYSLADSRTSQRYIDSIDEFLKRYNSSNYPEDAVYRECSLSMNESGGQPLTDNEPCAFNLDALGSNCTQDTRWGYDTNSPCIFLKINKVIDWEPQTIQDVSTLPTGLQERVNSTDDPSLALSRHVWVWCESDEVELEQAAPGVPIYYFPYLNQKGYLSPLVPVRIMNLTSDNTVRVQCRAWAKNIRAQNNNRPLGQLNLFFRLDSVPRLEL